MEFLNELLPIILYSLLCILVIGLIFLVLKLIGTLKNVDAVIKDVEYKSQKLNGLFDFVDKTADSFTSAGEKLVGFISNKIATAISKKRKEEKDE